MVGMLALLGLWIASEISKRGYPFFLFISSLNDKPLGSMVRDQLRTPQSGHPPLQPANTRGAGHRHAPHPKARSGVMFINRGFLFS